MIIYASKKPPETEQMKHVDAIFVDDDKLYTDSLINYVLDEEDVFECYQDPNLLFANLAKYPKNITIFLDNHFASLDIKGLDIAAKLHELGFTRIYILSGTQFYPGQLPYYLTGILKSDLDKIKDWRILG